MKDSDSTQKPISILMRDVKKAQQISRYLRRRGEVVYFYESLESFWEEVIQDRSKLLIVDVSLMSSGPLILKNHPLLQNEGTPLIFYYTEQTKPLLMSTKAFLHMGLLKGTDSWQQDLSSLLKRVTHFDRILNRYRSMENLLQRRDESLIDFQQKLAKSNEGLSLKNEFSRIFFELQSRLKSEDFLTSVNGLFENWNVVKRASIFTLDTTKRKLVSEKLEGSKYTAFPDMWAGNNILHGIDQENRETLFEVVVSNWGTSTLGLKLGLNDSELDHYILLKVDQRYFDTFAWHELEEKLNYYFLKEQIEQGHRLSESSHGLKSIFDLFEVLDQDLCLDKTDPSIALFDVNLEPLTELILKNPDNQFSFQKFYQSFVSSLKKISRVSLDCVASNHEHIAIIGDFKSRDYIFRLLKKHIKSFPYFRYFEGEDIVFANSPDVSLKMVPTSAEVYRQFLTNGSELIYHKPLISREREAQQNGLGFTLNEI